MSVLSLKHVSKENAKIHVHSKNVALKHSVLSTIIMLGVSVHLDTRVALTLSANLMSA